MAHQLSIPDDLYERLKQRAEAAHQTVQAQLVQTLSAGLESEQEAPGDVPEMLEAMTHLSDEALWDAARNPLAREATEKLRRSRHKRSKHGLSLEDWQRQDELLRQYDRGILIRSQALLLLKQRGHDIASLLQPA
jgi:plasmid stability protein